MVGRHVVAFVAFVVFRQVTQGGQDGDVHDGYARGTRPSQGWKSH